jgi:hypothetical protein
MGYLYLENDVLRTEIMVFTYPHQQDKQSS